MADMSEMIKNFSAMMKGKEIPDNIKEMMNSFMNSQNNSANSTPSNERGNSSNSENNFSGNSNNPFENIDIDTIMKMQKIMSAMKSSSNSSGANLLRSLKPYLKPSRQAKIDECIGLLGLETVISEFNNSGTSLFGGDKK